jgi:acylphosphatase
MISSEKSRNRLVSFHAIVHGAVQGVCFRIFTVKRAASNGITGTVRNLSDGTVEIFAEGPRDNLEKLIQIVKIGPERAVVDKLDLVWGVYTGKFTGFHQI